MSHAGDSSFATRYIDLAQPRLGARALSASDEFFASRERLLDPAPPQFHPARYDEHGKWMDGWETRRRRGVGHDFCIVRLGLPGRLYGVDVDTTHFTGNFAPAASLDAWSGSGDPPGDARWTTILAATDLTGDSHHLIAITDASVWTHLRLNIYPDGGVARLRVYGEPYCDWSARDAGREWDLAALENGGWPVRWNDAHFGHPSNLLAPGNGTNMGDGWETRRRREPGYDWCVVRLGHRGVIRRVQVDTHHFRGNFPDRCSFQAADVAVAAGSDLSLSAQSLYWPVLLPEHPLQAHATHNFAGELTALGPVTHVKLNIHPDGGVSRLRIWGHPA